MTEILDKLRQIMPLVRWRRLLLVALAFWLPVILFSEIAEEVREQETIHFDAGALVWLNQFASPWLDRLMIIVTDFGGGIAGVLAVVGLAWLLWRQQHYRQAVFAVVAIGGAGAINTLLKLLFARDRPSLWETLIVETTYSFPSGHAMLSSSIAFVLVLLFWHSRYRWWVVAAGTLYVLAIGLTRLYLGVHYPTDIVAGWCVSAAWVAIVATVVFNDSLLRRDGVAAKARLSSVK